MKAWFLDESTIWAGDTLEQAKDVYFVATGHRVLDEDVREVGDAILDTSFEEIDENEQPTGEFKTLRESLAELAEPGLLCAWDY